MYKDLKTVVARPEGVHNSFVDKPLDSLTGEETARETAADPTMRANHSVRARKWWTSRELNRMIELRKARASRAQIAAELGRSVASVKAQIGRFSAFVPPVSRRCPTCQRRLPRR